MGRTSPSTSPSLPRRRRKAQIKSTKARPSSQEQWTTEDKKKGSRFSRKPGRTPFFAPTPPWETFRLVLSNALAGSSASVGGRKNLGCRQHICTALADTNVFVALWPATRMLCMCARLKRCVYGTRDAPARLEAFFAKKFQHVRFMRGLGTETISRKLAWKQTWNGLAARWRNTSSFTLSGLRFARVLSAER